MKRRVLTSKANKRALRQIQAATGCKAPYNVLFDASFARMASEQKVESLVRLLTDGFGGAHVNVTFHPATHATLAKTAPDATQLLTEVYAIRVADRQKEAARSEVKAVVDAALSGAAASQVPGKNVTFVATLNHDIRRQVIQSCPVVRITRKPVAVWIDPMEAVEVETKKTVVAPPTAAVNSSSPPPAKKRRLERKGGHSSATEEPDEDSGEALPTKPTAAPSPISAMDVAFMKSLGVKVKDPNVQTQRKKFAVKKGPAAPNPLSHKKPKKRERLVAE